jgi:translation elongation factor EF-Tu-like GTPase
VARTLEAELRLLAKADGGRETPMKSGYRSLVSFGRKEDTKWGVQVDFGLPHEIRPGDVAHVRLTLWADRSPDAPPGTALYLFEGTHLVGRGETG